MSVLLFLKLFAIFLVVALGYAVGRARWLGENDPARVLSNAAFYIFVPALLFRTTARLDLAAMPWGTVAAFFVPVLSLMVGIYVWERKSPRAADLPVAAPSVRAISATFGNTVQVGLPMATALFGEAGLSIHIAIMSMHALTLLTVLTALVELDLARERAQLGHQTGHMGGTLVTTLRNTIIHPVVLPVLAGLAWNATPYELPTVLDEVLQQLGQAVVPLCLVLIGMSLAYTRTKGSGRGAITIALLKLLALPAVVLAVGHWGFHLTGMPLAVVVMMAALPVGSNALIFSQRYDTLQAEATASIVLSTLGFLLTAPFWLWVLTHFP
jgi:predicted permease